ncbi:MAG: 2,3-bisphosphoglycerate-independent phosphoglycerate mutase [Defluviitaleaceae bacterium]|nr:2,3-bisphosphoglycerate-independent phosphoglycerate mutase [Defluviitaleaceae bacterium]
MKPVVLIVMDGVALSDKTEGNAVLAAHTPNLDYLMQYHPWVKIKAHGTAVGLPDDGDMGNSEVGHNALGCGQIYAQGAKLVDEAIASRRMFDTPVWKNLVAGDTLHFIGLLSDGKVHANIEHLIALVRKAYDDGVRRVRIHILLDGRDVAAQSAIEYVAKLELVLAELNSARFDARIASGGGRQRITMDRYGANWGMVEEGWNVHVHGIGTQFGSASEAITVAREAKPDIIDQDLPPFVIAENGEPIGKIADGDSVCLINFRGDRAIELSQAFDLPYFNKFDRGVVPKVYFAGMLQYDGDNNLPQNFLTHPPNIQNTLTDLLVANGVRQFAVSETQKYGHMTYFWNGNRMEKPDPKLEDWVEINSDILPFEQRPWMKSAEIADQVIAAIGTGEYGLIRANMPNGDMVGHTGNLQSAIISVSAVDLAIGRIMEATKEAGAILIVTADHGNADEMLESDGKTPKTAHTLNPVPFIIYSDDEIRIKQDDNYGVANVASTIATLLNLPPHPNWEQSMI